MFCRYLMVNKHGRRPKPKKYQGLAVYQTQVRQITNTLVLKTRVLTLLSKMSLFILSHVNLMIYTAVNEVTNNHDLIIVKAKKNVQSVLLSHTLLFSLFLHSRIVSC